MYSESTGGRKTLGDVDVYFHDGIYHLFHLVLPNHDFVAHAVSNDCFSWRRVENALHLGDPGSFDDSMLWTTHVTEDPFRKGWWRMFYTGLSRRDHGKKQRIGLAESNDLYRWKKVAVRWVDRRSELPYDLPGRPPQPPFAYDPDSCFPLEPDPAYYESSTDEGRHWVSFRDPFYYRDNGRGFLLAAGRVNQGPVVRRGCVAVMEETEPGHFSSLPPLHHPGLYDDVEVPNLIRIDGDYYLVGSIREDAKVRYWHTTEVDLPWHSYSDNVLLPGGNYAGRICHDDKGWLLFSFYTPGGPDRTAMNLMPPPKRIERLDNGHLAVRSFEGFQDLKGHALDPHQVCPIKDSADGNCVILRDGCLELTNHAGFQVFAFDEDLDCFKFNLTLQMRTDGKCGLVFRVNRETHDGYYFSLDLFKGVAQARAWGTGPDGSGENMMQFRSLQSGYWRASPDAKAELQLIAYGSYLELSVEQCVVLTLADQEFRCGAVGISVESGTAVASNVRLREMASPIQSDEHLANG
ncbi:glycoside hydrolase family protein [Roseimaritima sediminicola]|uniref:glycosyl hydrolase n=1 Tax=Roseimaritima sediminicola TaxID=2662066 RepID=UPI00129848AA|nr:glycosyl hydrolase [Roseimaritima sediminicola]